MLLIQENWPRMGLGLGVCSVGCQKKPEARIYENVHNMIMKNISELLSRIFYEQEPGF